MDLIADHGACGCGMWDGGVSDPTLKCLVQHITKTRGVRLSEMHRWDRICLSRGYVWRCPIPQMPTGSRHKRFRERIILLVLDATPFGLCLECSPFTALALHWSESLFHLPDGPSIAYLHPVRVSLLYVAASMLLPAPYHRRNIGNSWRSGSSCF